MFLHQFFKDFWNGRKNTNWSIITLCKGSFIKKTVVMSASFRLSGKFTVFNISLKRFFKASAEISELVFKILVVILSLVIAFLGLISWTFFPMSHFDIDLKENLSWFTILPLMSEMHWWNLYLLITFSIGSEIFIKSELVI